jgi:hypothetical protein
MKVALPDSTLFNVSAPRPRAASFVEDDLELEQWKMNHDH